MITANMHEAKSRLSELVKAVEERGEVVVLCRNGVEVAEIRRRRRRVRAKAGFSRVRTHPELRVVFAAGYDPVEPVQPDELADWMR